MDRQQVFDAVVPCGAQYREIVIDQQGMGRGEASFAAQPFPEHRLFLGVADVVGADNGVEMITETGVLQFQRQAFGVGIGDQRAAFACGAQGVEKLHDIRMDRDQVRRFLFEGGNVDVEFPGPVIQAVPVQASFAAAENGVEDGLGGHHVQTAALGVTPRYHFLPEVIVEMQVQQGAVHIQQHIVYVIPVNHLLELAGLGGKVEYTSCTQARAICRRKAFIMSKKPRILSAHTIARTRLFHVEEVGLEFTNGTVVRYERLSASPQGAVLVVPMLDEDTVLLIREYAAGVHRYELGLPKGLIEADETILAAANRELMEEVGYAARDLRHVTSFTLAPGYFGHVTHVVFAGDLYEQRIPGDEPEEIEVVPWRMSALKDLVAQEDCTEARSIAALYMVRDLLLDQEQERGR